MPRSLHRAFALTVASAIALPDLPPGEGEPDVEVTFGPVAGVLRAEVWTVVAAPSDVHGWIPFGGAYRVSDGKRIVIDPEAHADERALRAAITGPLLGMILAQRGQLVLHASSVAIGDAAIAFFGPGRRGKSTLVAALAAAGHRVISDGMTLVELAHGRPFVRLGFPTVKLWPDSAHALDHDVEALPLVHPSQTKRTVSLAAAFQSERVALVRCFLLRDGDTEAVAALAPARATMALIRCTYQSSWLPQTGAQALNLRHCTALAATGVVRVFSRRRTFAALPDAVRFIEADAGEARAPCP